MSIKAVQRKQWTTKGIKKVSSFTLIGIFNTFTDFLVFNCLLLIYPTTDSFSVLGYNVIGFFAANIQSYWLNKNFTFQDSSHEKHWHHYGSFFIVSLVSLSINSLIFLVLQTTFSSSNPTLINLEKLLASGLGILLNYLGYQKIVFRASGTLAALAENSECLKLSSTLIPDFTLVLPAYNESERIEKTIEVLTGFALENENAEILIVDDGSVDDTTQKICTIHQHIPNLSHYRLNRNWGKGGAVRFGLSKAKGKYVFFCDADLSFPLHQLTQLLYELRGGADIIVGTRTLSSSQPYSRQLSSSLFRKLVNGLHLTKVSDTQCGFKGFKREALNKILPFSECCDFTFDIELLALAEKEMLNIKERALEWEHQDGSTIRITHILQMLYSLLLIRTRIDGLFSLEFKIVLSLFVLALAVRLPYLYAVPHFIDEWGEVRLASQIARGEVWPLHNTAHDIGSFYNYVLACLFTIFGHHLYLPRLFVAIISSGTIVTTYFLSREWLSRVPSLFVALCMATNSMHILVTHMAWSNDITPFFVTLSLLSTVKVIKKDNSKHWILCGLLWAIALQTHSSVLAPLIAAALFIRQSLGSQIWLKSRHTAYALSAFLVGYSNMILHNLIKPLDSIFWIHHKDYALNEKLTLKIYLHNVENMAIELARSLSSSFPNGVGFLQDISNVLMVFLFTSFLFSLRNVWRTVNQGKLLVLVVLTSFIMIPLFNNRYVYFISTRYIAYLFPVCYIITVIGWEKWLHSNMNRLSVRKLWTSSLISGLACLFLLLPLYHFYHYAAEYIQAGEDNSAEYETVYKILQFNQHQIPVFVDLGGKQGKAIGEMLKIKGYSVQYVGEQGSEVKMVNGPISRTLPLSKWNVLRETDLHGWFALSPENALLVSNTFQIQWKKTLYITRANGKTAYFIGEI